MFLEGGRPLSSRAGDEVAKDGNTEGLLLDLGVRRGARPGFVTTTLCCGIIRLRATQDG